MIYIYPNTYRIFESKTIKYRILYRIGRGRVVETHVLAHDVCGSIPEGGQRDFVDWWYQVFSISRS